MTEIDRDLNAALKLALKRPMKFALVIKAQDEGTLIVSKNTIQPKAIDQAKRELGANQVQKGRCSGDASGLLVFETAKEPAPNLAKVLRSVISRDAGLKLKVDARRGTDVEDDADDPAPGGNPAGDPAAKADVTRRLAALAEAYKVVMAGGGDAAEQVRKQFETIAALTAKQDYAAAAKAIDVLEGLLDSEPNDKALADEARQRGHDDALGGRGRRAGKLVGTDLEDYIHHYDGGFEAGKRARVERELSRLTQALPKAQADLLRAEIAKGKTAADFTAAYDLGFKEGDAFTQPNSRNRFTSSVALLAMYDMGYHDGEVKRWKRTGEMAPDND